VAIFSCNGFIVVRQRHDCGERFTDTLNVCLLYNAGNAPGNFDLVVENNSLDKAYSSLREFVVREVVKDKVDGESPSPSRARPTVYRPVGSFIYQAVSWLGRGRIH
jgi:hypothetical protein